MNSAPEFHPIFTVARDAIEQLSGESCLYEGAARAAADNLLDHWRDAIRCWGNGGPDAPTVEKMILGDLRHVINSLEGLLDDIAGAGST
jgi:hypothetical protein